LRQIEKIIDAEIIAIFIMSKVIDFTERFNLPSEKKTFLKYYNGYDVRIVTGLLK
jgi:hypothetical protein